MQISKCRSISMTAGYPIFEPESETISDGCSNPRLIFPLIVLSRVFLSDDVLDLGSTLETSFVYSERDEWSADFIDLSSGA